jgi:hypothetical protein
MDYYAVTLRKSVHQSLLFPKTLHRCELCHRLAGTISVSHETEWGQGVQMTISTNRVLAGELAMRSFASNLRELIELRTRVEFEDAERSHLSTVSSKSTQPQRGRKTIDR